MATTNDSAVVDLGRLKKFKDNILNFITDSIANAMTTPLPSEGNYERATANGELSCAIGNGSVANGDNSVAIGTSAISDKTNGVGIGSGAKAIGDSATAIGSNSLAPAGGAVAIGVDSKACGQGSISIGGGANRAETIADNTICIGAEVTVGTDSDHNVAIGDQTAIDDGVTYSVAIGANSTCTENAEFSVGNSTLRRRITHVIDPVNESDAATKKYVDGMSGGMHIVAITNVSSVLTSSQLSEIDQYWPNVIIYVRSNNTIFSPVSKIAPSNVAKYFTFIHVENTYNSNDGVSNGSTNILEMAQIVVNATDGSIIITTDMSLSPIIATNPSLQSDSQKKIKAIGDNSIAAGNNSSAMSNYAIALGFNSLATDIGAIAIGAKANAEHFGSIAFGNSSATDKDSQVSIGDKASGITRYLSNVKDPVEDQDAATRYWTKNADRSDMFAPYFTMTIPGSGTGEFYLEANADLNWIAVRGYAFWDAFSDVWAVMTNLPGESNNNWWIKTELKVPDKMIPKANFIGYAAALDFIGREDVPYFSDKIAVGTDGYIYLTAWSTNHGSTPLGILCLGHRFYM